MTSALIKRISIVSTAALYIWLVFWLAKVGSLDGDNAYVWALIEGSNLLGIDDAYRFHLSRLAFSEFDVYAWDYVLPVSTFYFGMINLITSDAIYASRLITLFFSIGGYIFLLKSGESLGIRRSLIALAVIVYALMPVQIIMAMSFYGEGLLVITISIGFYLFLKKKHLSSAFIFSLAPLIRPEGIFILAPVSLYYLLHKKVYPFLATGLAGFIFLVFLLVSFNGELSILSDWRLEIRSIWKSFVMPNTYNTWGMISTYNVFWLSLSVLGFFTPIMRRAWPLWLGSILWIVFYTYLVQVGLSSYESRYFSVAFPSLTLGFAGALHYLMDSLTRPHRDMPAALTPILISFLILIEHSLQIDPIKHHLGQGRRWPINMMPVIHPEFMEYSSEQLANMKKVASRIEMLSNEHRDIDTIIIGDWPILYFFERSYLSEAPNMEFGAIPQEITNASTGGSFFTYSQYGRKFSYFNITDITDKNRNGLLIFVGKLKTEYLLPQFNVGSHQVTVSGYREYDTPNWLYQGSINVLGGEEEGVGRGKE